MEFVFVVLMVKNKNLPNSNIQAHLNNPPQMLLWKDFHIFNLQQKNCCPQLFSGKWRSVPEGSVETKRWGMNCKILNLLAPHKITKHLQLVLSSQKSATAFLTQIWRLPSCPNNTHIQMELSSNRFCLLNIWLAVQVVCSDQSVDFLHVIVSVETAGEVS